MAKNYYETLGIDKNATPEQIKAAYRKMARQYHPDLHPNDPEAAAKFKEINEANETLSDAQKKSAYDYELEHPGARQGFGGGAGGFSGGFGGFSDMFGDIFSAFGGGGGATQDTTGDDITKEVTLSFLDAIKGCTKEITYVRNEPCDKCNGTGAKNGTSYKTCDKCGGSGQYRYAQDTMFGRTIRVSVCDACGGSGKKIVEPCDNCKGKGYTRKETKVTFNIPAGADNNSYIRKRGYGQASTSGGQSGDLIVIFRVEPHKLLKRKDKDLYVEVPISYNTAVFGGKIYIPGIDDTIEYAIPEGTQSGTVFCIKGKGVKRNLIAGNLFVTVKVEIPTKLDRTQRNKLEDFSKNMDIKNYSKMSQFKKDVESMYGDNPYKKSEF